MNGAVQATGSGGYLFNSNSYVYFKEGYGPLIGLGGSGAPLGASFINSNGTTVMYVRSDGNVGIGTTSPGAPLQVVGTVNSVTMGAPNVPLFVWSQPLGTNSGNSSTLLSLQEPVGNNSILNFTERRNANGTDWTTATTRIQQVIDVTPQGYIDFNPNQGPSGMAFGSGSSEILRLSPNGNVGIGTIAPAAKLEVDGSVKLTAGSGASMTYQDGTVQSTAWNGVLQGGDYAESVDVSGDRAQYAPGDVLVIDPASKGKFLKSSKPYSTAVMGVYSTRPGVVGRRQKTDTSHMKDEVPLAMVGVVPTKVTAEGGAIKAGDLLVTSSRPGYAMKGTDRSLLTGAIIGKALEPLDAGTGVIEVAISIQ